MVVEPGLLRTLPICFLTVASHRNQDDLAEFKFLSNFLRYLEAVHPRQTNIQQDEVRVVFTGCFQSGGAVVNRMNLVTIGFQK